MYKFIQIQRFANQLFDDDKTASKASRIMLGILKAKSPRISRIADAMPGGYEANYKMIQRFLKSADVKTALQRCFDAEAEFVIGDPTEIERAGARKTEYVGRLHDGQQRGFWMLTLGTPLRGCALPCNFVTYSSSTLGSDNTSRNLEHRRVIDEIAATIGDRPLVLDREFSYQTLFEHFLDSQMQFVIRLNQGSKPPKFYYDEHKCRELTLLVAPDSEPKIYRDIYYKGEVLVNVIGVWKKGNRKPLWVITNMPPEIALKIYLQRMKIEIVCTQMTKARVFTVGAGWNDIADFNIFVVYDHSINKQFYQLPALFKIQIIQGWLNSLAKFLDVVCQCQGLNLLFGFVFQLSQLLLETILGSSQFLALSLKFVSHDNFSQIHFQETLLLTFQTCQGLTDSVAFRLQSLRQPFPSLGAFQFVGNQIWVGYNTAEILPDEFIKSPGWHIAGRATVALSSSQNVTASPAYVIVILALCATGGRQTTLPATDQTPEKVIVAFVIATCHLFVLIQTSLRSIKCFLINDGWYRNCNPLLRRGWLDAFAPSHRQQGRFALACGDWSGAPTVGCAYIRRRTQNTPNSGWVPALSSSRCRDLLFSQLFSNPMQRDRYFWVSIPGKDLPNHIRFDGISLYPARITGTLRVQDIPIRRSRPGQQCSGLQFGLASTPHPLRNQIALVFGHRSTNLQQELIMGIIILHRAFQKLDVTTQVVQFFDQQNLMNIFARQAIRCGYQDQFEGCHTGGIPQPIQTRTIELSTSISIVAINVLICQLPLGLFGSGFSQTLKLLFNALTLHLAVGRYSGIEGDLHGHSPDWVILLTVGSWFVPSSSAEETGRHSPSDAVHRNILRLCDELAILFSCLLLNILCHLGEAYPKFLFPQSQRTTPPRQLQFAPSCQTEFVICDQTIEKTFRELKSILQLDTIMNKSRLYLEQMIALMLLTFTITVLIGEAIRDVRYAGVSPDQIDLKHLPDVAKNSRWHSFSGTFVLLRQRRRLRHDILRKIVSRVFSLFCSLIFGNNVRSFVPT